MAKGGSLGKALAAQSKRRAAAGDSHADRSRRTNIVDFIGADPKKFQQTSVVERDALDDYIATSLASQAAFHEERHGALLTGRAAADGVVQPVNRGNARESGLRRVIFSGGGEAAGQSLGGASSQIVRIPRRPVQFLRSREQGPPISATDLTALEEASFQSWRRELADFEEKRGLIVTPFEKNLEFWRQLWRVVERSDMVVQILDARDPLFFRCTDLEAYVKEVNAEKRLMLLINKADFLTPAQRAAWRQYFNEAAEGVSVVFFSALHELEKQAASSDANNMTVGDASGSPPSPVEIQSGDSPVPDDCKVLTCSELMEFFAEQRSLPFVIGMVGYPNVGKSSVINALMGVKKTSVSRQPGKTKHFQTLTLPLGDGNEVTLCDCPGLVFPSVVATKAHLVIKGVVSIDHYRNDYVVPIDLLCKHIPLQLRSFYGLATKPLDDDEDDEPTAHEEEPLVLDGRRFLTEVAEARGYVMGGRGGLPDLHRSAKLILRDFVTGRLVRCEAPPTASELELLQFRDCVRKSKARPARTVGGTEELMKGARVALLKQLAEEIDDVELEKEMKTAPKTLTVRQQRRLLKMQGRRGVRCPT